jgi:tetratricopeptide (TPR) repeat protein
MRAFVLSWGLILFLGVSQAQNTLSYTEIEAFYNDGMELYEKKAYPAARKKMHQYVKLSENSLKPNTFNIANASYYSAVSSLKSKAKDADIEVERFVVKFPDHPKAKLIFSDLANMYFEKGMYEEAIEYLEKSISNRQNNIDTYELRYKLGVAYYQKKDNVKALQQFDIVKNTASPSALKAAYYAGVIHFQNQNYDTALSDFKRVENVPPFKAEIPNWIAQIHYRQKSYTELVSYAEPIVNNPSGRKTDEMSLLLAEVYFLENNFSKSAIYYDKYRNFKKYPSDLVAFKHAYSYYKLDNFDKASLLFKNTASLNSEIGQQSAYYLGIAALKKGDLNAATLGFEEAKKLNFDKNIKEEAEYNVIKVLVEKNQNTQAISAIQSYLKTYPEGKYIDESNELLSDILSEANSYTTAISYIESLKRRTPKIEEAYQRLCYNEGIVEFNKEKFETAIKYFDKAINSGKDQKLVAQAKYWKAESMSQMGLNAENLYKELANSDNTEIKSKAIYNQAYLKFNNKDYLNAKNLFLNYLKASEGQGSLANSREDAKLRIADCYLGTKEYSQALSYYDQAYRLNSNDKDYALYQKGLALKLLDRDAEAKQTFELFSMQFSNSRMIDEALFQNGLLEMEKANYSSAISTFSDLLRRKANTVLAPQVYLKRGLAYANLQKHDLAINDYKLIVQRYGKTKYAEEALLGAKESLNALNRSEDFAEIADQYSKANPESSSAQNLQFDAAKDLYFAEKYERAIDAFKAFIQTYPQSPSSPDAKFYIAESYFLLNKKNEALSYYEELISKNNLDYISKSALRAADISFKNSDLNKAIKYYSTASVSASTEREIVVALEGLYKSYYLDKQNEKCIEICNRVMTEGANAVLNAANRAQLYKAKAYWQNKDLINAKTEFSKTINMAKDVSAAEAKYSIALIQYNSKEYDASIKTLQELSNDYSDFLEWYEKAFMLIADNYIAKNDIFMANATLKSIIENASDPQIIDAAKQKQKTLNK